MLKHYEHGIKTNNMSYKVQSAVKEEEDRGKACDDNFTEIERNIVQCVSDIGPGPRHVRWANQILSCAISVWPFNFVLEKPT